MPSENSQAESQLKGRDAPDNEREFRELCVFLEDAAGFSLAVATYDFPLTRDAILGRLVDKMTPRGVFISRWT